MINKAKPKAIRFVISYLLGQKRRPSQAVASVFASSCGFFVVLGWLNEGQFT